MKQFISLTAGAIFIILLFLSPGSHAESVKRPKSIEITRARIVGNPYLSQYVTLSVQIIPYQKGTFTLGVRFPKKIKYYDGSNQFQTTIQCDSGQVINRDINLVVQDTVSSLIEIGAIMNNAPIGYSNISSQYLNVYFVPNDFRIFSSTISDSSYYNGKFRSYQSITVQRPGTLGRGRSFYINGSIFSYDPKESGRREGLYNCQVEMYFANSSNPGTLYMVGSSMQEHLNYDKIHEDGSFIFNFSTLIDLSSFNQILLLVRPFNTYISFQAQSGYVLNTDQGAIFTFGTSEGAVLPFNPNNNYTTFSPVDIQINGQDGAICRNMEFAGEMLKQRYSGNIPFDMPLIYTSKVQLPSNIAGEFVCYPNGQHVIHIDPQSTEISVCCHEFGHYVNYQMFNGSYSSMAGTSSQMKEGWAIFYSYACRQYANRVYNDSPDDLDDNTETSPYENPRFSSMRYAMNGHPEYCMFACYLWNLYDSYTDGNFKTLTYEGHDNDDIGYGVRVFDEMRWMNGYNPGDFNYYFKIGLTYEETISIDKVYDNIFVNSTTKILSAQIANNASALQQSPTSIEFNWESQSYQTNYYQNPEEYYKIYKQTAAGNQWILATTISISQNSYTYNSNNVDKYNYKITSWNSSGDSYSAKIFTFNADPQLIVSINGPLTLNEPTAGNYSASISGGNGSYSYHWYISYDNGYNWISKGTNSTFQFHPDWSEVFALVRLDIESGLQTASEELDVQIICSGCGAKPISGISENENSFSVFLYPNPTHALIYFDRQLINVKIKCISLSGVTLCTFSHFSGNSLDLNELKSGTYILEIENSDNQVRHLKLIIQH